MATLPRGCPFFDNIPAEIRLEIYEFSFAPDVSVTTEETDLLHAHPPEKAVLQTCRKAYAEARDIYKQTYQHYWTTTEFCINNSEVKQRRLYPKPGIKLKRLSVDDERALWEAFWVLRDVDLEHVTKLHVTNARHLDLYPLPRRTYNKFRLVDSRGIWKAACAKDHDFNAFVEFEWLYSTLNGHSCVRAYGQKMEEESLDSIMQRFWQMPLRVQLLNLLFSEFATLAERTFTRFGEESAEDKRREYLKRAERAYGTYSCRLIGAAATREHQLPHVGWDDESNRQVVERSDF